MTAHAQDIAAVQKLLPVRIDDKNHGINIWILDRDGRVFCKVPTLPTDTAHSRAVVLVAQINTLQDSLVPSRPFHDF